MLQADSGLAGVVQLAAPRPMDERHPVLPPPQRAGRQRPRRLHGLTVGPHVDLAAAVLARVPARRRRRRHRARRALGRHLDVDRPRDHRGRRRRQGGAGLHARRDLGRGVGPARRMAERRRHGRAARRGPPLHVPRHRHHPVRAGPAGDRRRTAARQRRQHVAAAAVRLHAPAQPLPRRGLRAHEHRPGDDGGGQRGRPAGHQRDPRRRRVACARAARCGTSTSPRSSRRSAGTTSAAIDAGLPWDGGGGVLERAASDVVDAGRRALHAITGTWRRA